MSIDGTAAATVNFNDRRTVGINTNANLPVNETPAFNYTNGVGALQGNILYQAPLALSGGVYNLDLSGVVTDSYGSTVTAVRVKAIYVKNTGATALTIGNGTNPWVTMLTGSGTIILPPGAFLLVATPDATGWLVTAATGDILKFAGTGTATFKVILLGGDA